MSRKEPEEFKKDLKLKRINRLNKKILEEKITPKKKKPTKIMLEDDLDKEKEKTAQYKFYRESKVSLAENIFTALFVSIFIVFKDALNYFLKKRVGIAQGYLFVIDFVLILIAFLFFGKILISYLEDTFKPILVTKNTMATIEKEPIIVKKNGEIQVIVPVKDKIKT